jgi:hypothetical protein
LPNKDNGLSKSNIALGFDFVGILEKTQEPYNQPSITLAARFPDQAAMEGFQTLLPGFIRNGCNVLDWRVFRGNQSMRMNGKLMVTSGTGA